MSGTGVPVGEPVSRWLINGHTIRAMWDRDGETIRLVRDNGEVVPNVSFTTPPDRAALINSTFGWVDALVDCDENCRALLNPGNDQVGLNKAVTHWRYHNWGAGCSHGR